MRDNSNIDWEWLRRHAWVMVVGALWLIRLGLGTLEVGGMDPYAHKHDDPYPLAGILATCMVWITVGFTLVCLAYEAKHYRRPRRPRKPRLLKYAAKR